MRIDMRLPRGCGHPTAGASAPEHIDPAENGARTRTSIPPTVSALAGDSGLSLALGSERITEQRKQSRALRGPLRRLVRHRRDVVDDNPFDPRRADKSCPSRP